MGLSLETSLLQILGDHLKTSITAGLQAPDRVQIERYETSWLTHRNSVVE